MVQTMRNLILFALWLTVLSFSMPANSQIVHDGSLGKAETLQGPNYEIKADYGRQARTNLFHSFSQFNVNTGEKAVFTGPDGIANILGRVTGADSTWIDGVLASTIENADLYLINPNGIMFGPNASLDLNGSFHASTADYLRLGDDELFYAKPMDGELLSAAAPAAFGFLDDDVAPIKMEGKGEIQEQDWDGETTGLVVKSGETISLIGGNIETTGTHVWVRDEENDRSIHWYAGNLEASEGRINLASIGSAGEVILEDNDIDISQFDKLGDIRMSDHTYISTSGQSTGALYLRGSDVVLENSIIGLENNGEGQAGVIDIFADSLVLDDADVGSGTLSEGKGADIKIVVANNFELMASENSDSGYSSVRSYSFREESNGGDGGDISISAGQLILRNGAKILTVTHGEGNAGDIDIRVEGTVDIKGENSEKPGSVIFSNSSGNTETSGSSGKITIFSGELLLSDGAEIGSSSSGGGGVKEIELRTTGEIRLFGNNSIGYSSAIIIASLGPFSMDNVGRIDISAQKISLQDGASVKSINESGKSGGDIKISAIESISVEGESLAGYASTIESRTSGDFISSGDAGDILISANDLVLLNGAMIVNQTFNDGNGGDIDLRLSGNLFAEGIGNVGNACQIGTFSNNSHLEINTGTQKKGDAGDLICNAISVALQDGARLFSISSGFGDCGDIDISALESVTLSSREGLGYFSSIFNGALGRFFNAGVSGNIRISSGNLSLFGGSYLGADIYNDGIGGGIDIQLTGDLVLSGKSSEGYASMISTLTDNIDLPVTQGIDRGGKGGDINIAAKNVICENGGLIATESFGYGDSGTIRLSASDTTELSGFGVNSGKGAAISTTSFMEDENSGNAGDIYIESNALLLEDGSGIFTGTIGGGNGGDIHITEVEELRLSGFNMIQEESVFTSSLISSQSLSYRDNAGKAGDIHIEAANMLLLDGSLITNTSYGSEKNGTIELKLESLEMHDGSGIDSSGVNGSDGGDIRIDAIISILLDSRIENGLQTYISAYTQDDGNAGHIVISTKTLSLTDNVGISAFSTGSGDGGSIHLMIEDLMLKNGAIISAYGMGGGRGGDIIIESSRSITLEDYDDILESTTAISASSAGDKGGGTIRIETQHLNMHDAIIESASNGKAGDILITTEKLDIEANSFVATESFGDGGGGNIQIVASDYMTMVGNIEKGFYSKISTVSMGKGASGNISIKACDVILNEFTNIQTSAFDKGNAGNIEIFAKNSVNIIGPDITPPLDDFIFTIIRSDSIMEDKDSGDAGSITLVSDSINILGAAFISTATFGGGKANQLKIVCNHLKIDNYPLLTSESFSDFGGNAGEIAISADISMAISNFVQIITEATHSGGGQIAIKSNGKTTISNSKISSSVQNGIDNGGDITIAHPEFLIMNNSDIEAKAYEGDGGNIDIAANHFIQSVDSSLNASSELGVDGQILITSPEEDVLGEVVDLPRDYISAEKWATKRCSERIGEAESSLVPGSREGLPSPVDTWVRSPVDIVRTFMQRMPDNLLSAETNFRNGRFEKAISSLQKSVLFFDGNSAASVYSLLLLADSYRFIGAYEKARVLFQKASPTMESVASPSLAACFFSAYADLCLVSRRPEEAAGHIDAAWSLAGQTSDNALLASVLNHRGNFAAVGRDWKRASEMYRDGLEYAEKSDGNRELRVALAMNILRAALLSDDRETAIVAIDKLAGSMADVPDSFQKAGYCISLGLLAQRAESAFSGSMFSSGKTASECFQHALRIGLDLDNDRLVSHASGLSGCLHEARGEYEKALVLARRAMFGAQQGECPELLYRWQWLCARLFLKAGNMEGAMAAYESAVETLAPIRWEYFTGFYDRENLFSKVAPVYLERAELLIRMAEAADGKNAEEYLYKALAAVEEMKKTEIRDYFTDECVVAAESEERTLKELMPEDAALLYPVSFDDRLVLMLVFADGVFRETVPVGAGEIAETARRLNAKIREPADSLRYEIYAQRLYDYIVRPVEEQLERRRIETLVVSPGGALRLVPFAVLHDGEKFLVEKYSTAVTPGITFTALDRGSSRDREALLSGLAEARQGFSPLPNVPDELNRIKSVTDAKILVNENFTQANLEEELRKSPYSLIHMATHANFENDPEKAFLLTYDEKLNMDKLAKIIRIGRYREKPVELMTLSACRTALGDERAALGLGGVALKAGVKSALATLWLIDDQASSLVLGEFYDCLAKKGYTKAKALQEAQKRLIGAEAYAHPYYWAPFLLIGDWT